MYRFLSAPALVRRRPLAVFTAESSTYTAHATLTTATERNGAMNESECASLLASVQWTDPTNLVSLAVLAFINVLVIVGNCLVIAAVLCSHKLRSVTNFFIVSLAVADLLVGLAVLPFSATWEVFKLPISAEEPETHPDQILS
uniref:G-protein coupled receptors family 1 profile domain-containing protein n=1 Tax=Anopheles stephensi TaxID=30069 RepID=A0A182XYG4_ANOST